MNSGAVHRLQLGLAALLSLCLASCSSPPQRAQSTLRELPAGSVVGVDGRYGSHVWRGIPYATPPIGDLRWRAPLPARRWDGTLEAFQSGGACPQYSSVFSGDAGSGELVGSEDCLYLDVYAPWMAPESLRQGRERLPVMLWIHGGGNVIGRAGFYDGGNLAARENVVVVAINYRLGPLGWFRHESLRAGDASPLDRSGNFGTLDIIRALEWVQENISAFGGDPGNVTIFGESAGGSDVFSLMLSPLAKGLFQRAIMQSAGMGMHEPDYAELSADVADEHHLNSSGEILLRLLQNDTGTTDREQALRKLSSMTADEVAAYLRSKTPGELLSEYATDEFEGMIDVPTLFRDGTVLPREDPMEVIERGTYNQVPVMMGTNRDENKLFMLYDPRLVRWTFGVIPKARDEQAYLATAEHLANAWKARSVDELAPRMHAVQGDSVYAYRWDWAEEPGIWLFFDGGEMIGAAHGLEIPFVFGHFELGPQTRRLFTRGNRESRLLLSDQMMSYWAEFAHSGDPGRGHSGDLPRWRAWDDESSLSPKYIVFDTSAGGGLRMNTRVHSVSGVASALLRDERFRSPRQRCSVLRDMTSWGYLEGAGYASAGDGACAGYPLDQYPWTGVVPEAR